MNLPGLITITPDQKDLLKKTADMMGTSFLEENWFITWLSALDQLGTTQQRKEELMHAVFLDDLSAHAPYQGVYACRIFLLLLVHIFIANYREPLIRS